MTVLANPQVIQYGAVPEEDLDKLARALVAKGYTVAVGAPTRRYTGKEEWLSYAVVFHAGEEQGHVEVGVGNYLETLRQVEALPGASVIGLALDARRTPTLPKLRGG